MANKQESYPLQVNLENCAKEPIHLIGKSQSHGLLLVCDSSSLIIQQCGTNASNILGISHDELLRKPLSSFLDEKELGLLKGRVETGEDPVPQVIKINGRSLMLIPHLEPGQLLLDIEPIVEEQQKFFFENQLSRIINRFQNKNSINGLCDTAALLTKNIFGYDRVMIYKFDEQWNGEVISEVREEELESWLGLRYPATDIPEQSRKLFLKHRVRVIVDVNYKPVPIEPEVSPLSGQPVDISKSNLRAVSPIHIEYLQNMEVAASLSAAILVKGKLWGLIACHHRSPKYLDHYKREIAGFLAQMLSTELTLLQSDHSVARTKVSEEKRKQLVNQMNNSENIPAALISGKVKITDLISSSGAVIFFKGKFYFCGSTPAAEQVEDLLERFLKTRPSSLFFTRNLSEDFPEAIKYKKIASGLLSLRIAENKYIIWFRPEVLQTVTWGGDPSKKAFYDEEKKRISPRKSFEKWSEQLTGFSEPWQDFELAVVKALKENVSHIVLAKQRKEINALNEKLIEANKELELFSYGLSHDLRAPIRGLEAYLQIIKEDFSSDLNEEGKMMLQKTSALAKKMDQLVVDILEYSRLSHLEEMTFTEIDVKDLIDEILDFFNARINYPETTIKIADDLPHIFGDRRMLFQLWSNLLNNALKYSAEKEDPKVVIGYTEKEGQVTYFVSDNGIGIKNEFLETIFNTFSRVAGSGYKGSGIGLAIARKIVEKHDGHIWAESSPGQGASFLFSLGTTKRLETKTNDYNTLKDFIG